MPAAACLAVLALPACGGGGSGGGAASAPPPAPLLRHAIGGSVSGLVGTVVLRNDGAELDVASDGSFRFAAAVETGRPYAVTVARQPQGQTCVVEAGVGTATTDVTTVRVECADRAQRYWLPVLVRAPLPSGAASGAVAVFLGPAVPTGRLHVVPADAPAQPPLAVSAGEVRPVGFALPFELDSGTAPAPGNPAQFLYADTVGAFSEAGLWTLSLEPGAAPVPRRVGTLVLGPSGAHEVCATRVALRDLRDPGSAFAILAFDSDVTRPPFPRLCLQTRQVALRVAEGSGAPVHELPALATGSLPEPLYRADGRLAGLLARTATRELRLYADETFTAYRTLLAGVDWHLVLPPPALSPFGPTPSIGMAVLLAQRGDGRLALFTLDPDGAPVERYLFLGSYGSSIVAPDGTRHLTDVQEEGGATTVRVVELDRSGTARLLVFWRSEGAPAAPITPSLPNALLGVSGGTLVTSWVTQTPQGLLGTTNVHALPLTAPGPPTLLRFYTGTVQAQMAGDAVYVLRMTATVSGEIDTRLFETEVFAPDGAVRQPITGSSSFAHSMGGPILQVRDLGGANGQEGGTLHVLRPGTLPANAPALVRADGAVYRTPGLLTGPLSAWFVTPAFALANTSGDTGTVLLMDPRAARATEVSMAGASVVLPWY